ncbi:MAG: hypothetical protein ACOZFS_12420 [Thermodesulfobacteriota bacterium]
MKATIKKATFPTLDMNTPELVPFFSLELDPQGQGNSIRFPVKVKDLAAEGVILEVVDLPPGLQAETLLNQESILHMASDGFARETQLRSKLVWCRRGETGPSHYLLGLDLEGADFRSRRFLENLIARPKDISDLWTYWDQVQTKPASDDSRIIFYIGAMAFLGGIVLQATLPDSYGALATIMTFFGIYMIAGKCLWTWWRKRNIPKEC